MSSQPSSDQQLVAAAIALLATTPRESIRANDISEKAHVERTLINYHFGSVDNLLTIASIHHATEKIGRVFDDLARQTAEATSWLEIQGNIKILGLATTNEELATIGTNVLWCIEESRTSDTIRDIVRFGTRHSVISGAAFFGEISGRGWLSDALNPETYALFFLAAQFSLLFEYRTISQCPVSRYSAHRSIFPISQRSVTLSQAATLSDAEATVAGNSPADEHAYVSKKHRLIATRRADVLRAMDELSEHTSTQRLDMRAIAKHAHMSLGTLYRVFPSKRAILDALALQRIDRLFEEFDTIATASVQQGALPMEALLAGVTACSAQFTSMASLIIDGSLSVKKHWEATLTGRVSTMLGDDAATALRCNSCECYLVESLLFANFLAVSSGVPVDPQQWQIATQLLVAQMNTRLHAR